MMKLICSLFLIVVCTHFSSAQQYKPVSSVKGFHGTFTTDPLGNIYRYTGGDLFKYDPDGVEVSSYSSREYGEISSVDASNPMKVLVIFERFSKALVLDASLSANFTINLTLPGSPVLRLICLSRQDGYWVYDPAAMCIKKLNDQLEVVSEGTPLRQVSKEIEEPTGIYDSGSWILLKVPGQGIMVFDRYGTYFKTIAVKSDSQIQIRGNHEIMYKDGTEMITIDIQKNESRAFLLPENMPDHQARIDGGRIFLRKGEVLEIYSF